MLIKFQKCKCAETKYQHRCNKYCELKVDYSRNNNLSDYAKKILHHVHMNRVDEQEMFMNIAKKFSISCEHAQKIYDYMSMGWFIPSTPVTRCVNGFDEYPISCFVTTLVQDRNWKLMKQVITMYKQSLGGGGMGVNLSQIKEFDCKRSKNLNNGLLCYVRAIEAFFDLLKTDKARPPIFVYYINIDHPDVLHLIDIRKPTFDMDKIKLVSSHVGVILTDDFMEAVKARKEWNFISRVDGSVIETMQAIDLWKKIMISRSETGEPFIFFYNNAQRAKAAAYQKLSIDVPCTNMCTEIMLPSGLDHKGKERATICCLGSLNLEYYDLWKRDEDFIPCVMLFLDCVMQYYIDNSTNDEFLVPGRYCAEMSRPIGIGVMGWAYLLHQKMIVFGSQESFNLNEEIFKYLYDKTQYYSAIIGKNFGHAPDNIEAGLEGRFVTTLSLAPTSYISIVLGTSPGINPFFKCCYMHKTSAGSVFIKNKYLDKIIKLRFGTLADEIWHQIMLKGGSIQELDIFSQEEKDVFQSADEVDQKLHIDLCGDRQKYLNQTQSVNLFFKCDTSKKLINNIHFHAHSRGLPTLYYSFFSPKIRSNQHFEKEDIQHNKVGETETCVSCGN